MTEIQFLADLLLKDAMSDELKIKLLSRIKDLEVARALNPYIPSPQWIPSFPTLPFQCQHEYDLPHVGDFPPPCKKCGQHISPYIVTSGVSGSVIGENATLYMNGVKVDPKTLPRV